MQNEARSTMFNMRIAPGDLLALDNLRRHQADLPSRAEMLRRLIHQAKRQAGTKPAARTKANK